MIILQQIHNLSDHIIIIFWRFTFTYKIAIDLDNNIKQIKIITMQTNIKTEILSTIDELNQYLLGNVTKTSLQITLDELINKL